mgnify:FL=1
MSEIELTKPLTPETLTITSPESWDLLDECLSDGRLVPRKTAPDLSSAETCHLTPEQQWLVEQARTIDQLTAAAWADSTLRLYGWHAQAWARWCRDNSVDPLPLQPASVAIHLIDYAFDKDPETGDRHRNDDGVLQGSRLLGSVENRLAALNKLAVFTDTPQPGESKQIRDLMRGIRRTLGRRPRHRKAAIDHSMLTALVHAANGRTRKQSRNRLLIHLRHTTGLSAAQLAQLAWHDIDLDAAGMRIHLPSGPRRVVHVEREDATACVMAAVEAERDSAAALNQLDGPVFAGPNGEPLTRQGLHWAARQFLDGASGQSSAHLSWAALPQASTEEIHAIVSANPKPPSLAAKRNASLLLLGWHTALRRSNIVALNWGDLERRPNGSYAVLIRKSKTDQEGLGRTLRIARSPQPDRIPCPATALEEWKATLTATLGRPPGDEEPVFPALAGSGSLAMSQHGRPKRLDGEMVNRLIQELCVEAGLVSEEGKKRFGAHSLRAGYITEAFRGNKLSIPEVQDVSGHARVETLLIYRREANLDERNASTLLMGRLT